MINGNDGIPSLQMQQLRHKEMKKCAYTPRIETYNVCFRGRQSYPPGHTVQDLEQSVKPFSPQ